MRYRLPVVGLYFLCAIHMFIQLLSMINSTYEAQWEELETRFAM